MNQLHNETLPEPVLLLKDVTIVLKYIRGCGKQDVPKDNINPEYYTILIYIDNPTPIMLTYMDKDERDNEYKQLQTSLVGYFEENKWR